MRLPFLFILVNLSCSDIHVVRKRFATVWSLVLALSVLVPVMVENLQESDELILDVGHDEIS